jgi:peptide/nickel transport system substrate-binding protein
VSRLWILCLLLAGCGACREGRALDAGVRAPDAAWLEGRVVETGGTPRAGGVFIVRLPLEPTGLTRLHDRFSEGTMTRITVGPLYETLARLRDGALTPLLAESWVESDDHLTLTVTLRKDVRFHDGTPFTSADVKATTDVVLDEKNATAGFRASLETLARVEAVDPHTVVFLWSRPYFLSVPTVLGALPVLPAHLLKGDFDTLPIHRAPVGTGPFRFASWEAGSALVYDRNPSYWGRPAYLERVSFRFVKDEAAAIAQWERDDFELVTRLSPAAWRASESNPRLWEKYQRVFFLENTYAWLGFNQRQPRFKDAKTRRALGLLFPAELVARTVDLGLEPRTTCPYHPATPSCDPQVTPLPYAPQDARRLLEEAGWRDADGDGVLDRDGARFSFKFLMAAQSAKMTKLLPLYLDALQRAGIDAQIERVDVSAYMSRVRAHDFDAMALSWSSPDVLQDVFANFHSSQAEAGSNYLAYSDPDVDRWLEQIRTEFDAKRRAELERQVHRRVYETQAYLFLGRRPALDAFQRRVHGLTPSLGWYDLSAVWMEP